MPVSDFYCSYKILLIFNTDLLMLLEYISTQITANEFIE